MSRRLPLALVAGAAAIFFACALDSSLRESLTWDEPSFISAGYAYLTRGEFRYNPSHPPLLQALEAAPLLLMKLNVPHEPWEYWRDQGNPVVMFGRALVFERLNDPHRIAFWARLPILLLGTTLVGAVYAWGRRLYGPWPALVGVALSASCPNLIAHAGLATEDLGCTTLVFLAAWSFWHADHAGGGWRWARCGLLTGLAFLSKYTALLLVPAYLVLAAACLLGRLSPRPWSSWVRSLLIVGGVSALVVAFGYGPRLGWLCYGRGLTLIYDDQFSGYEYYLAGSFSRHGWWYYPLAALAFKVSAATFILLAVALALPLRRKSEVADALFVLVPAAVIIAASLFDHANLGLRRILPALPFLYLFVSRVAARAATHRLRPALIAALVALLGATASETASVHPHELSYISAAVGGPLRGPWLLDDSNVDWGQDLPALSDWQRAHPDAGPLALAYFGTAAPEAYGVAARRLREPVELVVTRPGTYAISVTWLVRFRRLAADTGFSEIDWLGRFRPIGRAGYSIYIYRVSPGQSSEPLPRLRERLLRPGSTRERLAPI
jgi:hypothetical protein